MCVERACHVLLLTTIIITGFGHTQLSWEKVLPRSCYSGLSKDDWMAQCKAEAAAAKAWTIVGLRKALSKVIYHMRG